MRAHSNQYRLEAFPAKVFDGKIFSRPLIQLESDVTGSQDLPDLGFYHIARQPVFGDAKIEHASRHRGCFKDGDGITHQRQIMRRRKPDGSSANDGYFVSQFGLRLDWIRFEIPGLRSVSLGERTLASSNLNRLVNRPSAARSLTRVSTNASADAGQGIGIASKAVGFFKTSFSDQRDVAPRVGVGGAGHHAREVGVEPIPINRLVGESLLHDLWLRSAKWRAECPVWRDILLA